MFGPNAALAWLEDYYEVNCYENTICTRLFFPENYLGEFPKRDDVIRFVLAYPERFDTHLEINPNTQKYMPPGNEELREMGF